MISTIIMTTWFACLDDPPSKIVMITNRLEAGSGRRLVAMLATIEDIFFSLSTPVVQYERIMDHVPWRKFFEEVCNVKVLQLHHCPEMKVVDILQQHTTDPLPPWNEVDPDVTTPLGVINSHRSQFTFYIFPSLEEIVVYARTSDTSIDESASIQTVLELFGPFLTARMRQVTLWKCFGRQMGRFQGFLWWIRSISQLGPERAIDTWHRQTWVVAIITEMKIEGLYDTRGFLTCTVYCLSVYAFTVHIYTLPPLLRSSASPSWSCERLRLRWVPKFDRFDTGMWLIADTTWSCLGIDKGARGEKIFASNMMLTRALTRAEGSHPQLYVQQVEILFWLTFHRKTHWLQWLRVRS